MTRTMSLAVVLALLSAVVLEPSFWAALTSVGELAGVLSLFCLVCLLELLT